MTAVERVVEYESVDPEDELESSDSSKKPPAEWPENGEIKFDRLSLRYFPDPDTELILKDLEFHIMPKEKVGVSFVQSFSIFWMSLISISRLDCRKNGSRKIVTDQRTVPVVVQRR